MNVKFGSMTTYVKERGAWGTEEEPRRILKNWQNVLFCSVLFSYLDIEYIGIFFTIILQRV